MAKVLPEPLRIKDVFTSYFSPNAFVVASHSAFVALQYTTNLPFALAEPEIAKPAAKSVAETEREILLNFIINTPYWIECLNPTRKEEVIP